MGGAAPANAVEATAGAAAAAVAQAARLATYELEGGSGDCVVCLEASKDHAFIPCGHLALCAACAALYERAPEEHAWRRQGCPVCRTSYSKVMRIFRG